MEYTRPKDILHVKPSGELYIPDPHAPYGDISPRVPILPGVATLEDAREWEAARQPGHVQTTPRSEDQSVADDRLWQPDFSDTESQNHQHAQPAGGPAAPAGHSGGHVPTLSDIFGAGIKQPLDLDTGSSVSDPIIFLESNYQKPDAGSGFKFPGKSTISLTDDGLHALGHHGHHGHHHIKGNMEPPPALVRKPTGAVKVESNPDYKVVIGLTYDDEGPDQVSRDYEDFSDESVTPKPFGKKELYDLCIAEVPQHLHRELCGFIRDGKIPEAGKATKTLQPRPSKLIQGPSPSAHVLTGQFVKTTHNNDPFAGIPTELPKQISKNPLIITSNSKVKIYRPFEESPVTVLPETTPPTRPAPRVTPKTRTTYSTTSIPPIITAPPLSVENRNNNRPLLFNKRDPNTGETRISKPFEYFSRLTQFFNNRVNQPSASAPSSGNVSSNRRRIPPPPRLQRHRLRSPPPNLT